MANFIGGYGGGAFGSLAGRRKRGAPIPKMPMGGAVGGYGASPKVGAPGGTGGAITGRPIGGFAGGKKSRRRKRG